MYSFQVPETDPLSGIDRAQTDVMMYCTGGIRCDVYSTMLNLRWAQGRTPQPALSCSDALYLGESVQGGGVRAVV